MAVRSQLFPRLQYSVSGIPVSGLRRVANSSVVNRLLPGQRYDLLKNEFTFGFHVTRGQNCLIRHNRVKPVFAADRLSSFAHFDFLASLCRQLRNRTERDWKEKEFINMVLQASKTLCLS